MDRENISLMLKQHRKQCNLSISDVISALQEKNIYISEKTLYGYENNVSTPGVNTFIALCDIYNISDVMGQFGYSQHLIVGQPDWNISMYNDFFNANLLGKVYILVKEGIPSFSGYETQLSNLFPPCSDAANMNRLLNGFAKLTESEQGIILNSIDEFNSKK